jgi:D-serine deaminase-like pyridoxal phosphate-dependent protein
MRPLEDLDTPSILVDLDVLEANIRRMGELAQRAGVRLRPHAKSHKVPEIGRMQLRAGARGLCLAKASEAEVFAAAGFDDLFVAYPVVGAEKARRLLALSESVRLSVGVDSEEGARSLGDVFKGAGRKLAVHLKVDVGFHRVGVLPGDALRLAQRVAELPGLELQGVFTHPGHAYAAETEADVARIGRDEGETLVSVARELRTAGFDVKEVSVGSTPTARSALSVGGVTECRPGNYVYHDLSQVSLGTCGFEDCALTVLATVVSVPGPGRAVVDAGSKTLSSDPLRPRPGGFGLVLDHQSRISRLSEEHGVVEVAVGEGFHVGERVRILPNHSCVVSNLHDRIYGVRGERVEAEFAVAARGKVH